MAIANFGARQALDRYDTLRRELGNTPLVYGGESMSYIDWSHKLNVTPETMLARILKRRRGDIPTRYVFAPNMNVYGKLPPVEEEEG